MSDDLMIGSALKCITVMLVLGGIGLFLLGGWLL